MIPSGLIAAQPRAVPGALTEGRDLISQSGDGHLLFHSLSLQYDEESSDDVIM